MLSNKHRGTLHLRIGPMFSSKSTWLNCEITKLADIGFTCLKIIHADDDRPNVTCNSISGSTHSSSFKSLSPAIHILKIKTLTEVNPLNYDVIGIDEAQFFPNLYEYINDWVENKGIHVRVVGLDGDFKKEKFGQILDIIPLCDEVVKLNAICKLCLDELSQMNYKGNIMSITAPFTKRIGSNLEQKEIGGYDKYIPVCRYHSY